MYRMLPGCYRSLAEVNLTDDKGASGLAFSLEKADAATPNPVLILCS